MEIWKDVIGYEGYYQVSDLGGIKSLGRTKKGNGGSTVIIKGKILKASVTKGYFRVLLHKDSTKLNKMIHRLIAESFIPNPENKPHVNHKNGIKLDNRVENLEWCTRSENTIHAFKTGLMVGRKGEGHHNSLITEGMARQIKYELHKLRTVDIARKLNISEGIVYNIRSGKSWRHI